MLRMEPPCDGHLLEGGGDPHVGTVASAALALIEVLAWLDPVVVDQPHCSVVLNGDLEDVLSCEHKCLPWTTVTIIPTMKTYSCSIPHGKHRL
jgi:hypothetical protein